MAWLCCLEKMGFAERLLIEAWTYGPVVPMIYHSYKRFGSGCIPPAPDFNPNILDKDTKDFLNEVFEVFGQFSAIRLMDLSHNDQCWQDAGIGNLISDESMAQCLKKYIANA